MQQYRCINGWTKKKMLEHVTNNFIYKSVTKDGYCAYRGENGDKCAVGLFIPDNLYTEDMDNGDKFQNTDVLHILERYPELNNYLPLESEALMDFQKIHDKSFSSSTKLELLDWIETKVQDDSFFGKLKRFF